MDLKDALEEGIIGDLFKSQRYYFIFRSIGEHYEFLKKAEKTSEASMLGFLQTSSHDLCILHLAKIFDNAGKKYKTRSLKGILKECLNYETSEIINLEYPDFLDVLQKKVNLPLPSTNAFTNQDLKNYLIQIIDLDIIQDKVKNLKMIRDKFIAHNEYLIENPSLNTFWNELRFLQDIVSLYITILGRYFLNYEYFQFYGTGINYINYTLPTELWWIYETLEKVVEKENLIYWWDQGE